MFFAELPRLILRLEGLLVLLLSIFGFNELGESWWLYVILFLVPDISMLGYLSGPVSGATFYNLGHTYILPALLTVLGTMVDQPIMFSIALIWVGHIGFDRLLGFGLKYPTGFSDTHLGRVGSGSPPEEIVGQ